MQKPLDELDDNKPLRVRRGRVESVDLYEIKDSELDLLENGSPTDLQLNFAIFVLSLAFSAICALSTATFSNSTTKSVFLIVSVLGIIIGLYLLLSWYRNRRSLKAICDKIRSRMKADEATHQHIVSKPLKNIASPPDEE